MSRQTHGRLGTRLRYGENIMKASTYGEAKGKSQGKTRAELGKLVNDPTLEGKDENKVGRVQPKLERAIKK